MTKRNTTHEERFWMKIDKNGPIPPHRPELGPCWVWTGSTDRHGYGQLRFHVGPGGLVYAHRYAFYLANGRWPEPCALHKCDAGAIGCVRHDHLFEGTKADNQLDMTRKVRGRNKQTHCKRGHSLDAANVRVSPTRVGTRRQCQMCLRVRYAERRAAGEL